MKLTREQGREIVRNEHFDWIQVGEETITGQRRWVTEIEAIFKHAPTGKHYLFDWERGSTESQDDTEPFEYDDPHPVEVELREVTKMEWIPV